MAPTRRNEQKIQANSSFGAIETDFICGVLAPSFGPIDTNFNAMTTLRNDDTINGARFFAPPSHSNKTASQQRDRLPATRPPPSNETACQPCKMPRKNKRSQAQKKRWKPLDLVNPAVPVLTGHNQDEAVSSFPSDQTASLSLETENRPTSLCPPGSKISDTRPPAKRVWATDDFHTASNSPPKKTSYICKSAPTFSETSVTHLLDSKPWGVNGHSSQREQQTPKFIVFRPSLFRYPDSKEQTAEFIKLHRDSGDANLKARPSNFTASYFRPSRSSKDPAHIDREGRPFHNINEQLLTEEIQSNAVQHFRCVSASHCQSDERYAEFSRNHQCTCNALTFLAYLNEEHQFNTARLDKVLEQGDALYCWIKTNLQQERRYTQDHLTMEDLPKEVHADINVYSVKMDNIRSAAGLPQPNGTAVMLTFTHSQHSRRTACTVNSSNTRSNSYITTK
ncbi:DNA-repair protein complementing XP-A cells [Sarotherodon galilaeus]